MSFDEFIKLREEGIVPDNLDPLLRALLIESAGNWDEAHRIAQNIYSNNGSWVHAYLHRKEGDLSNASYWYHNAGRKIPDMSLNKEWETIARYLLDAAK